MVLHIGDDRIADSVHFPQHLVVPEAENAEAARLQFGVAHAIVPGLQMLSALDLDDEPGFGAEKIRDVDADRLRNLMLLRRRPRSSCQSLVSASVISRRNLRAKRRFWSVTGWCGM
jgi:hypothetical protein